jgi:dipeptidase E
MPPSPGAVEALLARADIVLVSGGNTLFAVDRWKRFGLDDELRKAAARGCVLTGGSAGAICWFDAGHSDSADPESFADAMLAGASAAASTQGASASGGDAKPWEYIRCAGLGVLPGLCCPHHDRTQSNGVLRAVDVDGMLRRHNGETGVCIDHFAALVVDGADYSILSLEGKPGTALDGRDSTPDFTGAGAPWIWLKRVEGDAVVATRLAPRGRLADALTPATAIVEDPRVEAARAANPSDVDRP